MNYKEFLYLSIQRDISALKGNLVEFCVAVPDDGRTILMVDAHDALRMVEQQLHAIWGERFNLGAQWEGK